MALTAGTDPGVGISGYGTTLVGSVSGPIAMITKIDVAGFERAALDVSTMNGETVTDKGWRSKIPSLADAKGCNLDLIYHKTNTTAVMTALTAPKETWTIAFPDGSTLVVKGFFTKLGTGIPFDDKITQSTSLEFSGKPVWHEGSGS